MSEVDQRGELSGRESCDPTRFEIRSEVENSFRADSILLGRAFRGEVEDETICGGGRSEGNDESRWRGLRCFYGIERIGL